MSDPGFPSKSGGVRLEDYKQHGMIFHYEDIAKSLQDKFDAKRSNPALTASNIALFIGNIINFQNEFCGEHPMSTPRPFTRFPFEIFRDYNVHGRLHKLLIFMISYCTKQEWFKNKKQTSLLIDLFDANFYVEYIALFQHLKNVLKQQGIIKEKVVAFSPALPPTAQQTLAQIARRHGARIVDPGDQHCTHLIQPNNEDMADTGEENVRTLEVSKEDSLAYIHYWFYPSSYDEWIGLDMIDGEAEKPDEPPLGHWNVGERFLTDLEKYNEWMVEIDYEIWPQEPSQSQPIESPQQHPHPQHLHTHTQSQSQSQPTHQTNSSYQHQQNPPQQQQQQVHHHQHLHHIQTTAPQQIIHAQNVVISNGTTAHLANANTVQTYLNRNNNFGLSTLANAALNTNPNPNEMNTVNNNTNNNNKSRKRKRTQMLSEDPMIIHDVNADSDPDGDYVPPSKKPKTNHYDTMNGDENIIDLVDADDRRAEQPKINGNDGNKNSNKDFLTVEDLNKSRKPKNDNNNINSSKSKSKNKKSKKKHKKKKDKTHHLKFSLRRQKNPSTTIQNKTLIKTEIASKKQNMDPKLCPNDMFPYSGPTLTRIRPINSGYPIVIPSYSRWFRLDRIHPTEYHSLSTLFTNKSLQYHERYMHIRNFVVNTYRVNPRIYLTVTACRRMIAADAGSVFRIHKFLEEWGLINYQIDDGSIPEFEPPILDYTHIDTPFGVKIALKPADHGNNHLNVNDIKMKQENELKKKQLKQQIFHLRENMFSDAAQQNNDNGNNCNDEVVYKCTFCGIDCHQARYRCSMQLDMILCSKCFNAKRYSMIFDDNDFEMELHEIDKNQNKNQNNNNNLNDLDNLYNDSKKKSFNIKPWNDDELKKLKRALHEHHDDWSKVSEYVGRDKEECIAQFLQLPINDPFIDSYENKRDNDIHKIYHPAISSFTSSSISTTNPIEHMLSFLNPNPKQTPSPFADAAHPILGQAASLSAIVNSELVNVASNAALSFVSKQKKILPNTLQINQMVDTAMGRGKIENIMYDDNETKMCQYVIKFEWGSATLKLDDIIDVIVENNDHSLSWHKNPQNINQSKAKAAGVLGVSAAISKALKNHQNTHIQQLLQHLVLLQSHKVKAKLAHLEELWFVLEEQRQEVEEMKQELFRERIELAKQRLQLDQDDDDADDGNLKNEMK